MTYVVLPVRESNLDKAPMQTLFVVTSQCFEFHSLVRLSFLSSTTFHLFLEEPIGALIAAGASTIGLHLKVLGRLKRVKR